MTIKYKISDLAKDFNMGNKEIMEILGEYDKAPKSPAHALSEHELNVLFDVLSQKNQCEDIDSIKEAGQKAVQNRMKAAQERILKQEEANRQEIKKKEEEQEKMALSKPAPAPKKDTVQQPKTLARPQMTSMKQNETKIGTEVKTDDMVLKKTPQIHYVDTRGTNVNIEKYDERAESLVPDKAKVHTQATNKEKFRKNTQQRTPPSPFTSNKRRQEEQERLRRLQVEALKKVQLKVMIPDELSVLELATRLKKTAAEVVKQLMKLGVMASASQNIDFDTAAIVAEEFGAKVTREVVVTIEERLFDETEDDVANLKSRSPVVVVMGHVDHGKTSLLDRLRSANVTAGEAGGITQHIGAYQVSLNDRDITFLDTPGHAAFTSMRARGAKITDVAILVVAADDGIMPQTVEAINHAKAANVPLIVAINKMDKPGANPDRIMQQLTEYELVPEEWGGTTVVCKISAKTGDGIENLLEMVLLTADMLELKANPDRLAKGTVIEAKLDRGRGPVATVLIQNGTLNMGDIIIAGKSVGRVRAMSNDKGKKLQLAGPSMPVEIVGLSEVPDSGDVFYAVEDERMARTLAEKRKEEEKAERASQIQKVTLDNLFTHIEQGNIKDLNVIVKADVHGSAEAIRASLEKIANDEVRVRVIHCGVGGINDSDVMLASASGAIIVGFNVRPETKAAENAAASEVDIRLYRIIYDCIEEIESAMRGMLTPKFKEVVYGHAEIRMTYKVSSVGTIAGCYVLDGKINSHNGVRIIRDNIVIYEGTLAALKRFKDEVKEVNSGFECGMSFEKYNDIKELDIVEAFGQEQIEEK